MVYLTALTDPAVTTLPLWAKILLTLLSAPIVFGVLAIFYRNGVNIAVLIGGLTGLVLALRIWRHATRIGVAQWTNRVTEGGTEEPGGEVARRRSTT